jgi:hypothetical protein
MGMANMVAPTQDLCQRPVGLKDSITASLFLFLYVGLYFGFGFLGLTAIESIWVAVFG